MFASAVSRIRTQLTSYAFPHMRGPSIPLALTAAQTRDIGTMRNQPRITEIFGGPSANLCQGRIASRNIAKRRLTPGAAPAIDSRRLNLFPLSSIAAQARCLSPPHLRRSVWDSPSPSPAMAADPSPQSPPPTRTRVSRILVSPSPASPSPSSAPPPPIGHLRNLSPHWWALPASSLLKSSTSLSSSSHSLAPPLEGHAVSTYVPQSALGSDPLGLAQELLLRTELPPADPP
jgi:hypothetical protein